MFLTDEMKIRIYPRLDPNLTEEDYAKMTEEEYLAKYCYMDDGTCPDYGDVMSFDPEKEAEYEVRRKETESESE